MSLLEFLALRIRIVRRALPAAYRRAGSPAALLRRAGRIYRRGGWRGVKRAILDLGNRPVHVHPYVGGAALPGLRARDDYFAELFARAASKGPGYVPLGNDAPVQSRIRAIAFYLPQFHPIPENDAWWGKGFTEWSNVAKAIPQFSGHYQPRLPDELGFYDLRLPEVMRRQVELASHHGLGGFCFYYYWFSGKKLLERPLEQYLADDAIEFPFCVCWANENWTRRWDGREDDVLIAQLYREEDEDAFIQSVIPMLRDRRYIRIDGRPLLLVYRADHLPDPQRAVQTWRRACRLAGVGDPYLAAVLSFDMEDPTALGFDAGVEFPPHKLRLNEIHAALDVANPDYAGVVYPYEAAVARSKQFARPGFPVFRGVMPSWDNEARKPGRGVVYHGATPDLYAEWLATACVETDCAASRGDDKLVFINAWNEWGEGAYLEPDRRHGYAYLKATAKVLGAFPQRAARKIACVSHDAYFHGAQLLMLHIARSLRRDFGYEVHLVLCGEGPLRSAFAAEAILHDLNGLDASARRARLQGLKDAGIDMAVCNTSVVGDTVEMLADAGVRCVSLIHELPGLIRAYALEGSIARIARCAEKVVFPAQLVRDRFLSLQDVPAGKIVVRPQGLYRLNPHLADREALRASVRAELGIAEDVQLVLGVGFIDRRKGVDLFARVAVALAEKRKDLCFVWVGGQDQAFAAECAGLFDAAKASGRVVFAGHRDNADRYYAASDLYLLTSREDPFPSVVLEALDAGLPVVAFADTTGCGELIADGFGELVPKEDTAAMAAAVDRWTRRPDTAVEAFRTRAATQVLERFNFQAYVGDLLGLLGGRVPTVSVIVPNYNYAGYLEGRLRGILAQTRLPLEIIFLDDCSTDDSVAVAGRVLAGAGVPYRIVRNERNRGCYAQWLKGIELALGDLVWIAEADDLCEPQLLETLLPAFDDPEVVLAYCQSSQIDERGERMADDYLDYTRDIDPQKWLAPYVRPGVDELRDTLVVKNTIPNASAVLMRKPDLSSIESLLRSLRNAGDWLVYSTVLERGRIAFSPRALNAHRRHGGSLTLGEGKLRLMREIVAVQRHLLERVRPEDAVLRLIDETNQRTYEYLSLHEGGVAEWRENPVLDVAIDDLAEAPVAV